MMENVSGRKRIGILGGTFDPLHNGHLMIASLAKEKYGLDEVRFIPSCVSYMKEGRGVSPADIRLRLVSLGVSGQDGFLVDDIEIRRGGYSYTFETLEEIDAAEPTARLFLILGADSLMDIRRWKAPERIFRLATVIAASRTLEGGSSDDRLREEVERLKEEFGARIEIMSFPACDISSTMLRDLAGGGDAGRLMPFMPEAEARFIIEEGLYSQ